MIVGFSRCDRCSHTPSLAVVYELAAALYATKAILSYTTPGDTINQGVRQLVMEDKTNKNE